MKEITVLAHFKCKKGSEDKFKAAASAVVAPTHAEDGCIKYALHQSAEDACAFTMIEKWTSKEALDEHLNTPHIRNFLKNLPDLLEAPVKIETYNAVPSGGQPLKLF